MKIGIISDTHDHVKNLLQATKYLNQQSVELIYHCGDWSAPFLFEFFFNRCQPQALVKGVLGNNEGARIKISHLQSQLSKSLILKEHILVDQINNQTVAVYHGQDKNITQSLIDSQTYDLVFTGHTHKSLIKTYSKTLHLNPGTICDAAEGNLIKQPTLAIYDTLTRQAKIINFLREIK